MNPQVNTFKRKYFKNQFWGKCGSSEKKARQILTLPSFVILNVSSLQNSSIAGNPATMVNVLSKFLVYTSADAKGKRDGFAVAPIRSAQSAPQQCVASSAKRS